MSVLLSKDKKEMIVNCNCGCEEAAHIRIDHDDYDYYAIWTYTNGHFYSDQYGVWNSIKEKCKKIWAIIRNNDYYYSDIVMNKDEFEQFKEFINQDLEEKTK